MVAGVLKGGIRPPKPTSHIPGYLSPTWKLTKPGASYLLGSEPCVASREADVSTPCAN